MPFSSNGLKKNKIFISHSSLDIEIVSSFVEKILLLGLEISSDRIFCSSMDGHGIKSGQYIPDRLKEEINKSCIAILFISPNYKTSEVCLNEVGAAWATLDKENIIPFIFPELKFDQLGLLDLNRLGLKICKREEIFKFVQDCKDKLNPLFDLNKLQSKTNEFLRDFDSKKNETASFILNEASETLLSESDESNDDWHNCYSRNLYPFSEIIRKAIPAHDEGIHRIPDAKTQNQIMSDLSKTKFLKTFWYKKAQGDYYVGKLNKLPSGNWLISSFNWEVKISDMWVCMDSELQYEFILIKSEKQEPFKIDSDIGGVNYKVGILNDGTIVSENERSNGYAIIEGQTINLAEHGIEPLTRDVDSHWVFLVSSYHKAGYNADETIEFCQKLDSKEIEVNQENIYEFLRSLGNNPIVMQYR